MALNIRYAGISSGSNKVCNGIYKEGWREIVARGYDAPFKWGKSDNFGIHHIVAETDSRRHLGVISWIVDDSYKVPQVDVRLIYVRKMSRRHGIARQLHGSLVDMCRANGWGAINYTVNMHNRIMSTAQSRFGGTPEFITFQHEVK